MNDYPDNHGEVETERESSSKRLIPAGIWPWVTIFFLALGVRLIYVMQIRIVPFFDTLVGDAAGYDAWAQRLSAGDWMGTETFYQAPAYPYFLGAVYRLMGRDMVAIRVVQAFLGSLSCVFLGLAGRSFFSRRVGLVSALLLSLYPPAIFFDGLIQKTSLGLVLMTALLWRLGILQRSDETDVSTQSLRGPRGWHWLMVGVLLGVFGLTRENALVLVVIVLGWLWLGFRERRVQARLGWTVSLFSGLLLIFGPVAFRNHHVGGEWAITTVQAGPNFYIGNNANATGRYTPLVRGHESPPFERQDAKRLAEQATGTALTDSEVSRYWLRQSWGFIRGDPLNWIALLATKCLLTFNAYEITDTEGYNVYQAYSSLLAALGALFHFGVLCPLAAAGMVLAWPRRREHALLYGIVIGLVAGIALFYVFARYRFPLVPVVTLFAAAGIVGMAKTYRTGQIRRLAGAASVGVIAAIACNVSINPERRLDAMAYANLGTVLAQNGELQAAVGAFEIAIEESPDSPEPHYNLGLAYRFLGRTNKAIESLHQAAALDPSLIEVDYQLGAVYEAMGDIDKALIHYQRAIDLNPDDVEAKAGIRRILESAER